MTGSYSVGLAAAATAKPVVPQPNSFTLPSTTKPQHLKKKTKTTAAVTGSGFEPRPLFEEDKRSSRLGTSQPLLPDPTAAGGQAGACQYCVDEQLDFMGGYPPGHTHGMGQPMLPHQPPPPQQQQQTRYRDKQLCDVDYCPDLIQVHPGSQPDLTDGLTPPEYSSRLGSSTFHHSLPGKPVRTRRDQVGQIQFRDTSLCKKVSIFSGSLPLEERQKVGKFVQ